MNRIWTYLLDSRVLTVLGFAALAAFLFIGASTLQLALIYVAVVFVLAVFVWSAIWAVRAWRAKRAAQGLENALQEDSNKALKGSNARNKSEVEALRTRLQTAVKTIKNSKLGQSSGAAALYELPWYMVIGNPAAGKSTAIVKCGMHFPFADNTGSQVIQGIGGTRNCDWFFTSEGILLDTAGRYSVHDEDRQEWLSFLALLKKHRAKAPINGIIIAASLAELSRSRPEANIQLAKNLRQRVQELTEKLEVFAPVYLLFTKADLIGGFVEFHEDRDRSERDKVWGATLPYDPKTKSDAVALFDSHFDELQAGLKELTVARMSLHRGQTLPLGVLTFPLEFGSLKPALRAFVATLFEENPYQYRPIFRGFYFTSAVQDGQSSSRACESVAQQFSLNIPPEHTTARVSADNGFFLKELFLRVIFADRNLVKQYTSRNKQRARLVTFAIGVAVLALALGGWSWSYLANRQLVANVQADLVHAVNLQKDSVDLAPRLQAMELLQDRIEQLQTYRNNHPISLGLGLYQGDALERKLREEYFNGVRQVMLLPMAQTLESFLTEVNANAAHLQAMPQAPSSGAATNTDAPRNTTSDSRYSEASPQNVEDAYNALKTYLMLAEPEHREPGHLTDQITRFWRSWLEANRGTMPREQMIRSAERMITFTMANLQDPAFPVVGNNLSLVDQTRDNLRRVVRGMPARERVYAEIKARAATRYAPFTVVRIVGEQDKTAVLGSYTVSGTFTREAWEGFIEAAFKDAATKELQAVDWVLKTSSHDDLSLEGSPEQIRKSLTDMYKTEYVHEWQRFMQGISVAEFGDFDTAVARMNRLGEASNSPIKKLLTTLYDQTSWDNPSLINDRLAKTQAGFLDWFKQTILRQAPQGVSLDVNLSADKAEIPMGPIGREFSGLSRIMMARDSSPALLDEYLQALAKVRTRFNQIKTQGDAGPAARQMMASTLDGSGSELSDALKLVDEQMLQGLSDSARASLRPLLVRPLIQSFAVIVPPSETEVNRVWTAQVLDPFQHTLEGKYPFDTTAKVEANAADIAKVFGPDGAIAKFASEALGPLVVRRGDTMTPRTWADMGLHLRPEFSSGFAGWVAPLDGAAAGGNAGAQAGGGGAAAVSQTAFQVLPQGSPGLTEYTIEIDGQVLRYRNGASSWTNFVWPNPAGAPGVRISAITTNGQTIDLLNEPGHFGLERMFDHAQRKKLPDGSTEMSWTQAGQTVTIELRVISQPGAAPAAKAGTSGGGASGSGLRGLHLPALVAGSDAVASVPGAPGAAAAGGASDATGTNAAGATP